VTVSALQGRIFDPLGYWFSTREITHPPDMDSLQGQLLIASTELLDPNFARAVVLVTMHSDEGALGLILNRELSLPLQQVWGQVSQSPCVRSENVRQGGPVSGSLTALHDDPSLADVTVLEGLHFATDLQTMENLAGSNEKRAIFYYGHSGWGPGQLEEELAQGAWLVLGATADHVFSERDSLGLWKEAITETGRKQIQSVVSLKHIPQDPRLN
jgi:putative transcriptional regulator